MEAHARKTRSDSKLLNLPEEQQAKLADWLLDGMPYHAARVQVEKEFGVSVSLRAFTDFWHQVCGPALIHRRRRAVLTAEEIASEASNIPGRFDAATIDALKQQAFELAIRPNANPKDVHSLFSLVLKADEQTADRERLRLDREKFEFNASRAALAHLAELRVISANPKLDETAKINAVRERLFGKAAVQATSPETQ